MQFTTVKTLTAAALLAATTAASAGTAPFSMVSGATNPGVDVSLTIQQSAAPGYDYDFVVNNSSIMGIVTGVYFEVDWNSMLSGEGASSGPATLVTGSLDPQIDGWEGSKASHTVEQVTSRQFVGKTYKDIVFDNLGHGIQEGDSQVFSFVADGVSIGALGNLLGTDGYGVAIRMQGLTEDEQAAGWGEADQRDEELLFVEANSFIEQTGPGGNDSDGGDAEVISAPSPTAALAGLVVAGVAGLRRRRK